MTAVTAPPLVGCVVWSSKSAYHHLRCIRKIRNCIPMEVEACKLLVQSLVIVQRIAARVVRKKYTNDHTSATELLWGLHWIPIKVRVQYKILLLVYKALNTGIPPYLAALLTRVVLQGNTNITFFSLAIIFRVLILLLSTCIFLL